MDLSELQVSDVMVHRTEMVMINADLPPEELVREVLATEYTRIPLWRDKPENIIGVLHAKDLLRAIRAAEGDTAKIDVSTIALPPWFVPEMRPLSEQLKAFRRRKTHFALVVDEYGEVEGMVTLEDILEEIVGDISDEHDVVVAGVRAQPDGSVVVDGSVPIRDLNRAMDWHLPDEEATTVAGLVIHEARSIPERGQSFTFHGFRFRVLRRERNRITALRIVAGAARGRGRGEKAEAGGDVVLTRPDVGLTCLKSAELFQRAGHALSETSVGLASILAVAGNFILLGDGSETGASGRDPCWLRGCPARSPRRRDLA